MEVTRVTVQINNPGTDMVFLRTNLPSPVPGVTDEPLTAMFNVEAGKGVEYALTHFPDLPVKVIDSKTGEERVAR